MYIVASSILDKLEMISHNLIISNIIELFFIAIISNGHKGEEKPALSINY